jgi:nucleoside-diphosphate-sugar epimerase
MLKLALVGANGQVGAELCLLLAGHSKLELIPICRNRSGSSFLRWRGIACRHGKVAEPNDAERLLSDCDIVVNSSLATGTPSEIRRIEAQITRNIFRYSRPGASVIHFSTQSVYGDPRENQWIRWRNPYGRAKSATERRVRAESGRTGKAAHILRLGHVCGALQEISHTIRSEICSRSVVLPPQDRSSNTVYTAAIIGAIEQIAAGRSRPGTYDLMNAPRWTWREVYEYEAGICAVPLDAGFLGLPDRASRFSTWIPAATLAARVAAAQPVRDLFAKAFAYLPGSVNRRAMAWWYAKRAKSQIAALTATRSIAEHLSWVENGSEFFPAETATIELLRMGIHIPAMSEEAISWPDDLPDAASDVLRHTVELSRHRPLGVD